MRRRQAKAKGGNLSEEYRAVMGAIGFRKTSYLVINLNGLVVEAEDQFVQLATGDSVHALPASLNGSVPKNAKTCLA